MNLSIFIIYIGLILLIFNIIGNGIINFLGLKKIDSTLVGMNTIFGLFFISTYVLVQNGSSFNKVLWVSAFLMSSFFLLGMLWFRKLSFSKEWFWIIIYISFLCILSMFSPLGENMGDNVFYFQSVSLNINIDILNSFNHANGKIYEHIIVGVNDLYFTFYLFFSVLIYVYTKMIEVFNLVILPTYVYTNWLANIFFYTLSGLLLKNLIKYFQINSKVFLVVMFLFLGFYVGVFYYHLALPHIGNSFINIVVSFLVFVMYDYIKIGNKSNILLMTLISYGIVSMGNVGVVIVFYVGFGFIVMSLLRKDENIFLMIPAFVLPVSHYLFLLSTIDDRMSIPIINNIHYMYPVLVLITLLGFSLHYLKFIHRYLYNVGYLFIAFLWIGLVYFSYTTTENYWVRFMQFFEVKANFDRVQDFFSFNTLSNSIINLVHYVLLGSMIYYKKTRSLGLVFVIILVFFMNPFVYPLLYDKILWLYNRAYFSVFNVGSLGIGLYALYQLLEEKIKLQWIVFSVIAVISIVYGIQNLQVSFKGNYQNGFEMNPIYKLPQDQVDVLEELRQIIKIEELDTPKVVSQIYGTLMYLERIDIIGFTVDQRRSLYYTDEYSELLQIFYTPVFPGDDGLRLEAPVEKTCQLLMENQVDFVIYDKELSVFDSNAGNWVPTYWYIRDCYEKRYENERYVLYRYFW